LDYNAPGPPPSSRKVGGSGKNTSEQDEETMEQVDGIDRKNKAPGREDAAFPPCARYLGMQAVHVQDGRVRVEILPTPEMCNPQGVVQGGILAGMLDDVMGATMDRLEPGRVWATATMTVHFLEPVQPGTPLLGEAELLHSGRRTFFLDARLLRKDGTCVARSSATCLWQGRSARETWKPPLHT